MTKVLLSAYQCGAGMGSVSQIGWEWASRLSRRADVTLVTHIRNRAAIEARRHELGNSEVAYIDTEWFAGPLYRLARRIFPRSEHAVFLISSLDYLLFDYLSVRMLKRRMKGGSRWDVAHAVTPVSPMTPASLHRLGLPTVLGPLNGGLGMPKDFSKIMRQEASWIYPLRRLSAWLQRLRGSVNKASVVLAATSATRESVGQAGNERIVPMSENGVDLELFDAAPWPEAPDDGNPLRIFFAGRLIPVKGLPMLLSAVVQLSKEFPIHLTVAGDGPMRDEWQRIAIELGIAKNVEFLGSLGLPEISREMKKCHLFCLPSVRESGGAVLLEAMAAARPVIALAYGGPAEIVDDEVGRALPPANQETVIQGLVETLRDVVENPLAWQAKGIAGRCRVETLYSWEGKIEAALNIYFETQRTQRSQKQLIGLKA